MKAPTSPRLTLDEARAALPGLDELRPLMDEILSASEARPADEWAGSALLETAGSRVVDASAVRAAAAEMIATEQAHLRSIHELALSALEALAAHAPTEAAEALLAAAALEEARDRAEKAERYADAAVRLLRSDGDQIVRARALRRRGRARRATSRYAEAAADYGRAFDVSEAIEDLPGAAEAAIGAGNVLEEEGRWAEARTWYERAFAVLVRDREPRPERWHVALNLHVVLRSMGALEESLPHLESAERIADELSDDSAAQFVHNAWGQWYLAKGDFVRARDRLWSALGAASSARARVTIRLNLAEALLSAGRRLEAAEEARTAEVEAIRGCVSGSLPEVYRLLGRVAAEEGNPDAFVFFERALEAIGRDRLPEVERARTLEAYARAEDLVGEAATASELRAKARIVREALGTPADAGPLDPEGSSDAKHSRTRNVQKGSTDA